MKIDNQDKTNWVKYSSLGIEMAVIIGMATWCGVYIDRKREGNFPLFTLLLSALGFIIALIRLVRGLK